jgi:hypothetical protein
MLLRYLTLKSMSGIFSMFAGAGGGGVLPSRIGGVADSSIRSSGRPKEMLVSALGTLARALALPLALVLLESPLPYVRVSARLLVVAPPGNCDCQAREPGSCGVFAPLVVSAALVVGRAVAD